MALRHFLFLSFFSAACVVLSGSTIELVGQEINITDSNGLRQGYWQVTGKTSTAQGYRDSQIVEEGHYKNNRKIGVWKKYYPSGGLKNEITFVNNYPRGPYKTYYASGTLEEAGNWQGNKNIGEFRRYHSNGKLAQSFSFRPNGKRDGVQEYFYDNGKQQLVVEVKNGIVDGSYISYYPDGRIKTEKAVRNGFLVDGSMIEYGGEKDQYDDVEVPTIPEKIVVQNKKQESHTEVSQFAESGINKLYNHRGQVTQDGEFKNGRLWNGNWHRYDPAGNLNKIEVYKDGKFAGFAPIETEAK